MLCAVVRVSCTREYARRYTRTAAVLDDDDVCVCPRDVTRSSLVARSERLSQVTAVHFGETTTRRSSADADSSGGPSCCCAVLLRYSSSE